MNAFGEALNLVFMRGSGDFSSGSMPMEWISDCIPMSSSSYSPANELKTQDAFPWVPVSLPMNLRMHSHEFLSPCQWTQDSDCIPWVPIPKPMNLRLHSMSSYSPANESQNASHEFLFPCQIFGVFWLGTIHVLPSWFRNAPRIPSVASRTRFWVCPLQSHMGTPKIDCRAF